MTHPKRRLLDELDYALVRAECAAAREPKHQPGDVMLDGIEGHVYGLRRRRLIEYGGGAQNDPPRFPHKAVP